MPRRIFASRRVLPRTVALLAVLWAIAAPAAAQDPASGPTPDRAPTVVYLVRHAEKAAQPADDPPLTVPGDARARTLARMLGDAPLRNVYSTDYARTRQTAAPTAEAKGLAVAFYDPADPADLVARIRDMGGPALVVGHSNTVPGLVQALGGDPGDPIADDEYDRLYVVVMPSGGGPATTVLLRFEPVPNG